MEKYLGVNFSNGEYYLIPCSFIARKRTEYYAEIDEFKEGSKEWDEEYKYSMNDYEIRDWAANNMNWEDVEEVAIKVETKNQPYDYQKEWTNVDSEIVER